jgi:hypothetical protein
MQPKPFASVAEEANQMHDYYLELAIHRLFKFIGQAIQLGEPDVARDATAMLRILLAEQRSREI